MTLSEIRQLPGTTWIRDGKSRTIVAIDDLEQRPGFCPTGYVTWRRPGDKKPRQKPTWLPGFLDWISKAERVD